MPLINPSLTTFDRFAISIEPASSGDLEPGTKAITAVAEASGVANADYSWASSTYSSPGFATWLELLRVGVRLALAIDSKTANTLYCRVYVDAQDDEHRIIDAQFTSTGSAAAANDCASDKLPAVLSALADGANHTFYVFLWVDSGNAVISEVSLSYAIGSTDTVAARAVLGFKIQGVGAIAYNQRRYGTGTITSWVGNVSDRYRRVTPGGFTGHDYWAGVPLTAILPGSTGIIIGRSTVANDLNYVRLPCLYLVR